MSAAPRARRPALRAVGSSPFSGKRVLRAFASIGSGTMATGNEGENGDELLALPVRLHGISSVAGRAAARRRPKGGRARRSLRRRDPSLLPCRTADVAVRNPILSPLVLEPRELDFYRFGRLPWAGCVVGRRAEWTAARALRDVVLAEERAGDRGDRERAADPVGRRLRRSKRRSAANKLVSQPHGRPDAPSPRARARVNPTPAPAEQLEELGSSASSGRRATSSTCSSTWRCSTGQSPLSIGTTGSFSSRVEQLSVQALTFRIVAISSPGLRSSSW